MISRIKTKIIRDGLLSFVIAILKYPFQHRKRKAYKNMLNLKSQKKNFLKYIKIIFGHQKNLEVVKEVKLAIHNR